LCSVDAELLDPEVIDVLVARAAAVDADIVLPWDGTNHYLAAVYRTELAAVVDDLVAAGERNIPALIAQVDSQRVVISDAGSRSLSHA
jgi:molybdopterin-guanine dinucleotide biosynthesis protein A